MNDRHEAMDLGVLPSSTFALEMCKCEKVGPACWELNQKNDGKGKACPSGTSSFLRNVDPDMKVSLNALNSPEMFVLNEENQLRAADSSPKVRSTMYPAHFRAITEPGCRDVNENYYACVPQFQRDTAAKAEAGAALGGSCQKIGRAHV